MIIASNNMQLHLASGLTFSAMINGVSSINNGIKPQIKLMRSLRRTYNNLYASRIKNLSSNSCLKIFRKRFRLLGLALEY